MGKSAEFPQCHCCLIHTRSFDKISRGLGEKKHADNEHEGPCELDGDWDAIGACIVARVGGVIDDGGKQQSDGDGKLIGSDDCTTNPFGCRLRLVEGDCELLAMLCSEQPLPST